MNISYAIGFFLSGVWVVLTVQSIYWIVKRQKERKRRADSIGKEIDDAYIEYLKSKLKDFKS